jgi:hypothetical protein
LGIRAHLTLHATKNTQIVLFLVIERQEVKKLARVQISKPNF